MQSYTKVFILLSLLAASITLISFYHPEQGNLINEVEDNLDCGFTDDFSTFLKNNGIFYLIQVIQRSNSIDPILNVELLEENLHLLKK